MSRPTRATQKPTLAEQIPFLKISTRSKRLIFQVTGAFAEFERAMIKQRVGAGLKVVEQARHIGRSQA